MAGSFGYSRDADVAASARDQLERAARRAAEMESAQRNLLTELIGLWSNSAWLAAGAVSAKDWLLAYTGVSVREAQRLERIAGMCASHPELADAVVSGELSLRRADRLGRAVTAERAPYLAGGLASFLALNQDTADEEAFDEAVRFWAERVDEQVRVRRAQPHTLWFAESLFGGGEIHGQLAPVAFATVRTAVDAFTQDPDPKDAPHRRSLSERRADALDDLATFALTHDPDHADSDDDDDVDWEAMRAEDTFDGSHPGDDLDEALAGLDIDDGDPEVAADVDAGFDPVDPMVVLRRRLRRAEKHRRRRVRRKVRARSGVCTNVHIDLRTLAGIRDIDDLDDLVLRGEGWSATRAAAERLLCDSQLVATLFDGKTRLLDANEAAERFSRSQRRALAARDGHCVFPSCTRPPRHCDAHHLKHREHRGPTTTGNGALLCRFHHRLIHEYGWELLVDDTGHWVAVDPHGTRWTGRPANLTGAPTPTERSGRRPANQDA
jgi:hypothetical protein